MLELISLKFQGIGRFVEQQEIVLAGRPSVIGINAINKNTGGSSGGAKSTIFKAIDWLYGINETPTTVLKSRYAKDMEVTGHFNWQGRPLTISRSTKSGLFVEWTDQEGKHHQISGNSALAEEKIDEILGLSRELFRLVSHKRQGEMGFFLNLSPKESFEFLMNALGLGNWQRQLDVLAEKISASKNDFEKKSLVISIKKEELSKLESLVSVKNQAVTEAEHRLSLFLSTETVKTKDDVLGLKNELKALEEGYRQSISGLIRPNRNDFIFEADPSKLMELSAIENKIAEEKNKVQGANDDRTKKLIKAKELESTIKAAMKEAESSKAKIKSLQSESESIKKKIEIANSGSCHTCGQHWVDEKSKKELSILENKLSEINNQIQENQAKTDTGNSQLKLEKLADVIRQLSQHVVANTRDLELQKKQIESEINQAKTDKEEQYTSALHQILNKTNEIESDFKKQKGLILEKIEKIENSEKERLASETHLKTAVKVAEKEVETASLAFAKGRDELEVLQKQLFSIQKNIDLSEEARKAIKSYLMTIFEDTLSEIGTRASKTLSMLPNMNTATIYFEPFKEITSGPNKGKVKEEVTAILSVDGELAVPIKSVSGGERASIDLAVDLAVVDLIEENGGVGTNYLILDEPCTGMDSVNKEQYIDILKNSGTKKKILIVDHSSEIKEMVDDTIVVIREGIYSRIEGQ